MLLFDRLVLAHVALQIVRVAFAVAVFAALRVLGHGCSRRLLTAPLDPLARALIEIAVGFAAYATLVRLAAAAGLASGGLVLVLLLVPLAFAARTPALLRVDGENAAGGGSKPLRLAVLGLALLPLPMALAPAVSLDALTYQLRMPEVALRTGSWALDPLDSVTFFPAATQCLYMPTLAFDRSGVTAQLVHYGFFLLTLLALKALADRLDRTASSWWSSLLFAAIPAAGVVAGWSWSDMPLCFALVTAGLALTYGEGVAAIVAIALAAAIKYSGLLLGIPLLVALVVADREPARFRRWSLGAALGLVVLLPWYGANLLATGNPVYPLLPSVFHGARTTEGNLLHWAGGGRAQGLGGWWQYAAAPSTLDGDIGGLGTCALLAISLLHGLRRRGLRSASVVVFAGVLALAPFEPSPRILLPVLAGACAVAAVSLSDWEGAARRRWPKAIAGVLVARGAILVAAHNAFFFDPLPAAVGIESGSAYVARNFPPFRLYERAAALPEDAIVLAVGESRMFGFPRPTLNSAITDLPAAQPFLANAANADEPLRRLRARGVTHLLVDVEWLSRPGSKPSATASLRLTADEERRLREVLSVSKPVDREGPLALFALPRP
jgi:4-amino-4-deoxy-L-arabinose transferase-like glycosyltransferase